MGKTSKSAWTGRERDAARLFGSKRQRCSGSSGREDCSRSDSTHDTLFMEVKLKARHTVRTLFDETKALAKKEGKTPVLMLADKSRPGMLVAFHTDDLETVIAEYIAAHPSDELEGKIRRAFERVNGALDVAQPAPPPAAIPWLSGRGPAPQTQQVITKGTVHVIVGGEDGLTAPERSCCGGPGRPCCDRAEEYNGFGSDGPPAFLCPNGCPCHD